MRSTHAAAQVGIIAVLAAVALLAFLAVTGLLDGARWRHAGRTALHLLHFDHDVRPNRATRRAMGVQAKVRSLFMMSDDTGAVTSVNRDDLKVEVRNGVEGLILPSGRFAPILTGGSPEASVVDEELTVESLAGTSVDTLRKMRATAIEEGNKLAEKGESLTRDERKQMRGILANLAVVGEALAEAEGDQEAIEAFRAAKANESQAREALMRATSPALYGVNDDAAKARAAFKTPGETFTESDAYKEFGSRGYEGGSQAQPYPELSNLMGFRDATKTLKARAIVTAADTVAGDLVRPEFLGLQEPGLTRPLTIRDLVTVIPVGTDAIEYVKETSRTSGAAPVAEATSSSGASGQKPEGGLVFDIVTTTVKTIAEWVAATTRILADAPQLRAYIDNYLLYDLALELEDQMIAGDGTGENFTGILNTVGVQTLGAPGAGESNLDQLRKAIRMVQVGGRTQPTGIALHPTDSQNIDLLKINNEVNHFAGSGPFAYQPNAPIWGRPRVETEALTAGTALVGDFRRAALFDRQAAQIRVGTANDDFIRNIVRVLAELRAGFGVFRPAAFVKVTLA